MNSWTASLPAGLTDFVLIITFSLLIGLSQRRLNLNKEATFFGSDRTFTLIGLFGYILYMLTPGSFMLFAGGGLALAFLLGLNYYFKVNRLASYGITSIITALITYCIGPMVCLMESWFFVSVVVIVLVLTEMKSTFVEIAQKMDNDEFITLAKFLLISFIILPMLPDERIIPEISLTPYRIWLATVIISGISYLSYLMKRYIFPKSGVVVSGFLGGLYSSTATMTILGRKCKKANAEHLQEYATAMFMAVGMMFLRLLIIIAIFNADAFRLMVVPMTALLIVSLGIGFFIRRGNRANRDIPLTVESETIEENNPLEFKVALIFAFLYVVFTVATYFTLTIIGTKGLTLLSFLSGVSDITPFILNLLEGHYAGISLSVLTASCLIATLSNNIIKMFYAMGFSGNRKELAKPLFFGFGILSILNLAAIFIYL